MYHREEILNRARCNNGPELAQRDFKVTRVNTEETLAGKGGHRMGSHGDFLQEDRNPPVPITPEETPAASLRLGRGGWE